MPLNHCLRVAPPSCIYLVVDLPPAAFSVVPFFPASFIPVIDFRFDTFYSRFLSFLHLSSCRMYFSSLVSHCQTLYCRFLPVIFLHVMFSVGFSSLVFLVVTLLPLSLLSLSFLSLYCSFRHLSLSSLSIPSGSLVILISTLLIVSISLAISAVRQSDLYPPVFLLNERSRYASNMKVHIKCIIAVSNKSE